MMQMLSAAGLPVMTDLQRQPDEDNPEGYFEWEEIRNLRRNPAILRASHGKVVKIVSMLLPSLPAGNRYRVIFMDRPVEEVAASQQKMLRNRDTAIREFATGRVVEVLRRHRAAILAGLQKSPHFENLIVDYPALVTSPKDWVPRIAEFLGGVPESARMYSAIRPALHRNRRSDLSRAS